MRVLITGGTGFIGRHLIPRLLTRGDQVMVLSRRPHAAKLDSRVAVYSELAQVETPVDAVINLAGAPIADKRWSDSRKALLRESRIELTRELVQWMGSLSVTPKVLISGSAIGYYGSQGDKPLGEDAEPKLGFTHELCADWEREAQVAEKLGVRVCCIRTGVVLGDGGALQKMLPPFKLGLGGPIASGRQWMSWIHVEDEVGAILHLLDQEALSGPFNLTAPNAVSNETFSKTLAHVLGKPAFFRVPAPVMHLIMGEAAELVVKGQRVIPSKLEASGYRFRYPELESALNQVLNA
jgi:uncharacterized protein (TIGR01777 family)